MSQEQSANQEWLAKIDDYTSGRETGRTMTRYEAVTAAAKKYPELRERVVDEANE